VRSGRRTALAAPPSSGFFGEGQTPGNEQENANKYQRKPSTLIIETSSDASSGTAFLSQS
jgi:hypothetical protein